MITTMNNEIVELNYVCIIVAADYISRPQKSVNFFCFTAEFGFFRSHSCATPRENAKMTENTFSAFGLKSDSPCPNR